MKKIVYEKFTILNNHTLQTFKYKKNPLCFAMGVSKIFLTYKKIQYELNKINKNPSNIPFKNKVSFVYVTKTGLCR